MIEPIATAGIPITSLAFFLIQNSNLVEISLRNNGNKMKRRGSAARQCGLGQPSNGLNELLLGDQLIPASVLQEQNNCGSVLLATSRVSPPDRIEPPILRYGKCAKQCRLTSWIDRDIARVRSCLKLKARILNF
jgi:hypothetical protein